MRWLETTIGFLSCASAFAAALAAGCESTAADCRLTAECGGRTLPACFPGPDTGPVAAGCGVFVSPSAAEGGDGSPEKPLRSLSQAISAAAGADRRVYACAGVFEEAIVLPSNLTLFGGLRCDDAWLFDAEGLSTIAPSAGEAPIRALAGEGLTDVRNVHALATAAGSPGSSAIAVIAEPDAQVMFVRSTLEAGPGTAGADGETSTGDLTGANGEKGRVGCGDDDVHQNSAAGTSCGVNPADHPGGNGGYGGVSGTNGAMGETAPGGGIGGKGEDAGACASGEGGSPGEDGSPGVAASGIGTFDASGYTPAEATPATNGTPGKGGGGGGGGRSCDDGQEGPGGGGGGAGGCAGKAGSAGRGGGSSVGLLSLGAAITWEESRVIVASGGDGGDGGDGQIGGDGGLGGDAGAVAMGESAGIACAGGSGGKGGNGGAGAGGPGGHAAGIAFTGVAPASNGVTITLGSAGKGGLGGATNGPAGTDGLACAALAIEAVSCGM